MEDSVIHVSHETHELLKQHCADYGYSMKKFVDMAILSHIYQSNKKRLDRLETQKDAGVWERPPFWKE